MKTLIVLLFLIQVISTNAQNKQLNYKYAVGLNFNTSFSKYEQFNDTVSTGSQIFFHHRVNEILKPGFFVRLTNKNKNQHELELTSLVIDKVRYQWERVNPNTGFSSFILDNHFKFTNLSVRYAFVFNFLKNRDTRFVPYTSLGIRPFYQRAEFFSHLNNPEAYSRIEKNFGADLYLNQGVIYNIKNHLFLRMDLMLNYLRISRYTSKPLEHNFVSYVNDDVFSDIEFIPKIFSFSMGVGFKIASNNH